MSFLRRQKAPSFSAVTEFYKFKTRFSMLGTVGSGKTTVNACIVLTAQTYAGDRSEFKIRTLEGPGGILEAVSNLREGRFPTKTPAHISFALESGILLYEKHRFRDRQIHIPICDMAGEDIQLLLQRFQVNQPSPHVFSQMSGVINYIRDSDGFIMCAPASKAKFFLDGGQLEEEPDGIARDPDVNLYRILNDIIEYKERTRGKGIKGIAVVITKWDLMQPYAEKVDMDVYTPRGRDRFLKNYFPSLTTLLDSYGLEKVVFFPSWLRLQYDEHGAPVTWTDGSPKIERLPTRRVPRYAETDYMNLIEWLMSFAS